MKKLVYILFISLFFVSCSDFQKALRSEDIANKFKVGTELFEAEKWNKAHRIFEQVVPSYRGKPQAEKLMYMHAMSLYKMGERSTPSYYSAAYRLEQFKDAYPKSEKAEEAFFLAAKSYYMLSPVYSKEQKETVDALEKLQLFVNQYPNSEYLSEANKLIKDLDFKLEKKAFEIAKQYNQIRDYKASIKSFNNFLLDFPGSELKEDALYYRFVAEYNLAMASVDYKKEERVETGVGYYRALEKAFPNSEYLDDAKEKKTKLEALNSTQPIEVKAK